MSRPRSDIRLALLEVFAHAAPCGWRDVLPHLAHIGLDPRSPSEALLVRRTVVNMARAGELVRVGSNKAAGRRVWHALYEPAEPAPAQLCPRPEALSGLATVMSAWGQA